jgi:hypothetical protein
MESRAFWILVACLTYPVLAALGLIIVVMPPINIVGVPIWFALAAGVVGRVSNGIAGVDLGGKTRERVASRSDADDQDGVRSVAGVLPVQRTNAL